MGDIAHNNLKMEDKIMREHKMFIVVLAFAILQSITLWGQQPNDEVVWLRGPSLLYPGYNYNIRNAVYSPDGQTILVSFTGEETGWHKADIKCTEVDAVTGAFIREVPIQGIIQFSADGEYVYTYDWKKVRWPSLEVVGQFPLEEMPSSQEYAIDEVAGKLFLVDGNRIAVFDLNTFEKLPSFKPVLYDGKHSWSQYGVAVIERGKYIQTGAEYYTSTGPKYNSFIWDISTGDTTTRAYPGRLGGKESPDGLWVAGMMTTTRNIDSVVVFSTSTYQYSYLGEPDNGYCQTAGADWSHDSRYFITSSYNCNTPAYTCVWDVLEGKLAYKYKSEWASGDIVHISPDNKYILESTTGGLMLFNFLKGTDVPLEPKVSSTLYPNPTNGTITIPSSNFKTGKLRIELTGLDGNQIRVLYDNIYQGNNLIFDLSGLPQGTYFIKAIQGKTITTFKVIKMR